ncbi:proprotein convertase P-domain-containing protein [Streptomyces sp. wa22]|uniref:proprotein convertase P-domain-containing protein n=1 Tax=Streptomyces sp. wa22 TaxID=1828244 RepID=UPI0011CBC91F|nr:proprotein convertase P-domain-containing protein [Streptomyces sp. wa22]TXS10468.1 serine protease [Streptomyces sp. wa22]
MNRPIWTVVATAVMALAMGAAPAVAETPSPDAPSAPVTSGSIDPSLYGAAAEKGTVRVNVVTEERSDLSGASSAGRTMQKFQKLPLVTLQVTRSGLDALAAKPGVVSVTEDTLSEPTLDTSMPFIGGDRAIKTGKTGKGSAIAVIDTGVATKHPFLQGRVVSEACFSPIDPAYSATSLCPQGTAAEEGPGTADSEVGPCATITECEHGTHVAGIAAGDGTGIVSAPVSGVAPDADVIAIQVFSRLDSPDYCGEGNTPCVKSFTSAQVAALEKVLQLRQAGIPVITANLSLGGGQYSSPCGSDVRKPMIDALLEAGVATVVAAGNNGFSNRVNSPACVDSAITVGSSGYDDTVSEFSNRGSLLDLFAPGDEIVSSVRNGAYGAKSGTSMSAPHVAGALAVLRQTYPAKPVTELEQLLKSTGKPIVDGSVTTPRLDIGKAVGGSEPTPPPTPEPKPLPSHIGNYTAYAIPDPGIVQSPVTVSDVAGKASKSLQVRVNLMHDWHPEIKIDLIAPDGKSYPLKATGGSQTGGALSATYTADASTSPADGTWKLQVEDRSKGGVGTLKDWSLIPASFAKKGTVAIPDAGTLDSDISVAGLPGKASGALQVQLDAVHEWSGDLKVDLIAPDGTPYRVKSTSATDPPVSGTYTLDARTSPASGTWTLRVQDTSAGAVGSLNGWSLTFPSYESQTPVALPDADHVRSPITVSGIPGNAPKDIKVYVDITHGWLGDLNINLVDPNGKLHLLKPDSTAESGGTLQRIYTVDVGTAPASGTWNLSVDDTSAGSTGTLNGWTLTF